MDLIKRNKILKLGLLIMLIFNIVLIYFLLQNFEAKKQLQSESNISKNNSEKKYRIIKDLLSNELKFNENQISQLNIYFNYYIQTSNSQRDYIRKYHKNINENIVKFTDSNIINRKFDTLGYNKAQLDKESYQFFKNIYSICSPEQKPRFVKMFREIEKLLTPKPSNKNQK